MDNLLVSTLAPDGVLKTISEGVNQMINSFEPFFVNLTNEDSSGIRSMAEGREGEVRAVAKIAVQHIDSLARSNDPAVLVARLAYDDSLESVRQTLIQMTEMITNTQTANSADIMKFSDRFTQNLQTARKDNAALDEALKPIDEYNKRFGNRGNNTPRNTDGGINP